MARWLRHVLLLATLALATASSAAERSQRPMNVLAAHAIGLEVWVENAPAWTTEAYVENGQPVLLVSTPPNYYPPAQLSYATLPLSQAKTADLLGIARGMVESVARKFGVSDPRAVVLNPTAYNGIAGFETSFVGQHDARFYDIKIFVGRQTGRAPLALAAYTPQGKLAHLSEPLRRAWSHVRYLEENATQ